MNSSKNTGGQLRARIFRLQANGDFLMFQGFVNAPRASGPYTVSLGDPITGYAGRWMRCKGHVKVVFIKHYYWPDELQEFMEPALTHPRVGEIAVTGDTVLLRGERYWHLATPPDAEVIESLPSPESLWRDHPDVRGRLDAVLGTCD